MKALFVATVQSHIAQFHLKAIELLKQNGYEVHVAARDNLAEKNGLQLKNVDEVFDIPFLRSPFSPKNLAAYKSLRKVICEGHYDLIHCNTPVGGILTRIAARKESGKVLYTAHGFHFYKGAPLKNWILYYPIEKIMAHYTDGLITINDEDYKLAKNKFHCPVYRIHGVGINTKKFNDISKEKLEELKDRYHLHNKVIILCTGELNNNKDQETVISAMTKVIAECPDARLLLAGNGPKENVLRNKISDLHLSEFVKLIGYRTDLQYFVHISDLVVSASLREGLGLNLIEAMFCHKPVIGAENRGHRELIIEGKNGYLVPPKDSTAFSEKIISLCKDQIKRIKMGSAGYEMSMPYWDVNVLKELKEVYR